MKNNLNKSEIRKHFLYAALWTEELDADYNVEDFAPSAIEKADKIIDAFIQHAPKNSLQAYMDHFNANTESQLGHDIWLSINGHGAGFFDHTLDGHEDILQEVCSDLAYKHKIAYINHVWVSEVGTIFIE